MKLLLIPALAAALAFGAEKTPSAPKPDGATQITITLGDLVAAQPALAKLFAVELPVKTSWGLRKTAAAIDVEIKRFYEQRTDLIKKYGKLEANGNGNINPENLDKFNADYTQLTEIKVELAITPIPLSALGDSVKLSPSDMQRLEPFIAEGK